MAILPVLNGLSFLGATLLGAASNLKQEEASGTTAQ